MPNSHTVTLNRDKETKNTIRFKEEETEGKPPIVGSLYLPKWVAANAASIQATISILN